MSVSVSALPSRRSKSHRTNALLLAALFLFALAATAFAADNSTLKPEGVFTGDYVPESPSPSGEVISYDINLSNGTLTQVNTGSTAGTGQLAVNHAGTLLYATELGPTMAVFSIGQTGSITQVFDTISTGKTHSFWEEGGMAVHPNDNFVYAGAYSQGIIGYQANKSGTLADLPGSPFSPLSYIAGIIPSGKFMYGVNTTTKSPAAVVAYSINTTTGAISVYQPGVLAIRTKNGKFTLGEARMDALGKYIFVTDQANNAIYTFAVNQTTGTVKQIGTTSTGTQLPQRIAATPTDKFLYVGSTNNPDILGYAISQTGQLTPLNGGKPFVLPSPNSGPIRGMRVDLTGHYIYANTYFCTNGLSINQTTGNLKSVMTPIFDANELTDVAVSYLP